MMMVNDDVVDVDDNDIDNQECYDDVDVDDDEYEDAVVVDDDDVLLTMVNMTTANRMPCVVALFVHAPSTWPTRGNREAPLSYCVIFLFHTFASPFKTGVLHRPQRQAPTCRAGCCVAFLVNDITDVQATCAWIWLDFSDLVTYMKHVPSHEVWTVKPLPLQWQRVPDNVIICSRLGRGCLGLAGPCTVKQ
eukprot:3678776-Amphidinium_carterae.1